mgnify:CR=1 FL=1
MGIVIRESKLLCCKGSGEFNEDVAGISRYGAWVLDGATGLNNKKIVSDESDAKWYVDWWNNYLSQNIDKDFSLKDILYNGIDIVTREYKNTVGNTKVDKLDIPSCSIVIIKYYKDKLEYLVLGDCTLLTKVNNNYNCIKDESVCRLDEVVFNSIKNIENINELSLLDKKNKVLPVIIENRLKKNTKEGYWILEFNKDAVDNAIHGFIDVKDEISIVLTSDGFSCAFDRYNLVNKKDVFSIVQNEGIDHIYNKIRNLEREDLNGIVYPRFKMSDDSTCVYLNLYNI